MDELIMHRGLVELTVFRYTMNMPWHPVPMPKHAPSASGTIELPNKNATA
jgi:hypothetical protein